MKTLRLGDPPPLDLPDAGAEGFAAISRLALRILSTVCRAEAVEFRPCATTSEDPGHLRRELLATMERLGYFPRRRREARTDREALELLRDAMPCDEVSLALVFLIRGLTQSNPAAAHEELTRAAEWARRAVLSPL